VLIILTLHKDFVVTGTIPGLKLQPEVVMDKLTHIRTVAGQIAGQKAYAGSMSHATL